MKWYHVTESFGQDFYLHSALGVFHPYYSSSYSDKILNARLLPDEELFAQLVEKYIAQSANHAEHEPKIGHKIVNQTSTANSAPNLGRNMKFKQLGITIALTTTKDHQRDPRDKSFQLLISFIGISRIPKSVL